jgi:hypothetical protein
MVRFYKGRKRKITFKKLKNGLHSCIGHIIRHNMFVVDILEGAISVKICRGKTSTTALKASRQKHRSWQLYSNVKNGLQQFQAESCQPIKTFKDKKKRRKKKKKKRVSQSWQYFQTVSYAVHNMPVFPYIFKPVPYVSLMREPKHVALLDSGVHFLKI